MIQSGELTKKALIYRKSEAVDDGGQPVVTGVLLATVRCSVEPLSGREYFEASGETHTLDTRIRCYYQSALAALAPADWLEVDGIEYDIISVINPRMLNTELQIMCKVRGRG